MNYTVLVVEDEYELRKAVVENVDWESAGFSVVGEAENGVEALDLLETLEPDLILTDIKMPMISGLELAKRVREIRPATGMVILSGYDSFEYAREAINYNIIAYLLKPISSAELSKELFAIKKRMDDKLESVIAKPSAGIDEELERMKIDTFLLPLMLGSNEQQPDETELERKAAELGIIKNDGVHRFCVLVSKFKKNGVSSNSQEHTAFLDAVLNKYLYSVSFTVYGRTVTFAVTEKKGDISAVLDLPLKEIVQTAKKVLGETCTIGVSREFSSFSECSAAYFQAVTARRYTKDGAGEVRYINDQEHGGEIEIDRIEKTVLKLEQLLKVGDNKDLSAFINGLFENSTPENADLLVMQILVTVYRVLSNVTEKNDVVSLLSSNQIFSRMTTYNSESGVRGELIELCQNAKSIITNSQRRDSEVLCDRAVQIINERYSDEELSLNGVSRELAVSPNYLSALIKKTKKKSFVTLLTEKRMTAAYDMLICTSMKVLEIAEKCGYSDQHYFSYCFKKYYGASPAKVRSVDKG